MKISELTQEELRTLIRKLLFHPSYVTATEKRALGHLLEQFLTDDTEVKDDDER